MKDKANNSRGMGKDELTQAYKSYADYGFTNNETHHLCCENAADYVFFHQLMMNINCLIGNVYCERVQPVSLLLSQELKEIHQTQHQLLCLTRN